jgi:portal protein
VNIFGYEFTLNNLFAPKKEGRNWWYRFFSNRSDAWQQIDYIDAYESVPEVAAIINMKAKAFSNMKLKEVDKEGNEKQTTEGQALIKLITNPNWFQQGKEFLIQTKTFRELFGNEYIFKTTIIGFKPTLERTKALYTIPDNIVKPVYDNVISYFLHITAPKVIYKIKNELGWVDYNQEQIIHFNDNRVSIKSSNDKDLLRGESKLKSNSCIINNMKAAYQSKGVIIKKRGANGAWVTKSKDGLGAALPMEPKEKDELQRKMEGYGTMEHQDQDIITNTELAWVQRGPNNPKNLGLDDEIEKGFMKLLDSFGVPPELFARVIGSTYENQKQAEKGLYVRTIIPEGNEWIGGVSSEFMPEGGQTSIVADYMHLPIFQEDLKQRGDSLMSMINALSKALMDGGITIEQYKQELLKFNIK